MYAAIITLPLVGATVSGLLGRKIGVKGAQLLTSLFIMGALALTTLAIVEGGVEGVPLRISLVEWVDSEYLLVRWGFRFDALTVSMLLPVLTVSLLVHLFAIEYMGHDPHNQRFYSYLSLFTFMMVVLVTADNMLVMFLGWEGVGICSYLLVNFWFTRIAANQSSLSALLTNRVGDFTLVLGAFAILQWAGSLDYDLILASGALVSEEILFLTGILILVGAMAKSSQLGLHAWLAMAMEGPTPVSALIHAATMVTAGIYLLVRLSPILELSSSTTLVVLLLGTLTTFFSSVVGLFQQDMKKIIAYSTMSQLGLMVVAVGMASYSLALAHLVNHAFYKALLFLSAGVVIHSTGDNQDLRRGGSIHRYLPLTYSVVVVASLSLAAFPFMTGFYSKDTIIECAFGSYQLSASLSYIVMLVGASVTVLYSMKIVHLSFLASPGMGAGGFKGADQGSWTTTLPLISLALFSIFFGYVSRDAFIGVGSPFLNNTCLQVLPESDLNLDLEFSIPSQVKTLPLLVTLAAISGYLLVSEMLARVVVTLKILGCTVFNTFSLKLSLERLINGVTLYVLHVGAQVSRTIDKGVVEFVGPRGAEMALLSLSSTLASTGTRNVTTYGLHVLLALNLLLLVA